MSSESAVLISTSPAFILPRFANRSQWITTACILSADLFTLLLVFGLTVVGRHLVTPKYDMRSYVEVFPYLTMLLAVFWFQGLYPGVLLHPAEEMKRIFFSVTIVFLLLASTTFLWRNAEAYSRSVFLITWAAGSPVVLLTRYLTRRTLGRQPWWGVSAMVFGSGPTAQRVVRRLRSGMLGVRVIGAVSEEQILSWARESSPFQRDPNVDPALSSSRVAHYAIVAMPERSNVELQHAIQDYCRGFSHVLLVPDMPWLCSLGVSARDVGGEVGFEMPQRLFHRGAAIVKRLLDVSVGGLALLFFSPLFVSILIAIKLTSPGPTFYSHTRYGRKGERLSVLKFRTMLQDGERVLMEHLAAHPEDVLEWARDHKLKKDPRVTRVGRLLRRFSLDELPQLLNVLAGRMSLVGPRPIVRAEIEKYGRGYGLYTRVRPGITGLWQVSGRNNTTYEERVAFDEYYVRNWSIWLDAYILICTVKAVLIADGAY